MAHGAHALVVVLLLDDLRQLLLDVGLDELDDHVDVQLLVHDGEASVVFIACLNECREEYLLHLLVVKVRNGKRAQLLNNGALALAEQRLILLVMQAEVPNQQNCLMQELFTVLLVLCLRAHCVVQNVVEQVVELLLDLEVAQNLLGEAVVHAEDVIDDLEGGDGETQNCLRQDLLLADVRALRGLERLVSRQEDRGYHLDHSEELCVLDHEEDVLCYLIRLLIDGPVDRVHGDKAGQRLQEVGTL